MQIRPAFILIKFPTKYHQNGVYMCFCACCFIDVLWCITIASDQVQSRRSVPTLDIPANAYTRVGAFRQKTQSLIIFNNGRAIKRGFIKRIHTATKVPLIFLRRLARAQLWHATVNRAASCQDADARSCSAETVLGAGRPQDYSGHLPV